MAECSDSGAEEGRCVSTPEQRPDVVRHRFPRLRSRTFGVALVIIAVLVVGVSALVWWGQRSLIYFPGGDAPSVEDALPGAEEVSLSTEDDLELAAWFLPANSETDRGQAVLYLPGNAGDRSSRNGIATELSERGLGVLLLDYRGFGGNPGSPSEEGLARDARAGVDALEDQGYSQESLIYMGESLGTGVAARLHHEVPPAGLVLRSPFTDLAGLGQEHYPAFPVQMVLRDEFPVLDHVSGSDVPATVIYGDDDEVVPAEQSREVAVAAGQDLVEEVEIPGAQHNDPVMFGPEVAEAAVRLADSVD